MFYRICLILCITVTAGCSKKDAPKHLPEVVIDSVVAEFHTPSTQLIGRVEAFNDVALKANVKGYLLERKFKEGQFVEAGASLFLIDSAPFKAELARAKAEVFRAEAASKVAELNFRRGSELRPQGAISASEFDKLTSDKLQAQANVEAAKANLISAEVNLSYTDIKAPFSGNIGRSLYSTGDLVGPDSEPLTTLVNVHPVKVIFHVSEIAYLNFQEQQKKSNANDAPQDIFSISLELSTGHMYEHIGKIDYIANRVDPETGTIEGRAVIANPDSTLIPGQYTKVIFNATTPIKALFIPQAAIQADQQGTFALSIGPDNTVVRKNVLLDVRVKDKVLVKQGLNEGDSIIIRGLQQVRPGQLVKTKHVNSANPTTDNPL